MQSLTIQPTRLLQMQQESKPDKYTPEILKRQYNMHKEYVKGRIQSIKESNVKVRLPCIPEDMSENIIKNIIHNKLGDKSSTWDCAKGDLFSNIEGKQECKCFTSNGPLSFTPSSEWDVIYFLDARQWLEDKFVCYRIPLKKNSDEWKNIKVNKTQTFDEQSKEKRRPRINWLSLHQQISPHVHTIFDGTFDEIFIPSI